jgi:hypothetical protein
MSHSVKAYVLAGTQSVAAGLFTWTWFRSGDGEDLVWAAVFGLFAVGLAAMAYARRGVRPPVKPDLRVLRRMRNLGGVMLVAGLVALVWRVHGEWIRLGESLNLVLAFVCIMGLVFAVFGELMLREE